MIIFLYGPDDYRREEKKKTIIKEYRAKHSLIGIASFDLEQPEAAADFQNFIVNQSIFDPLKLAVLNNVFATEEKSLAKTLKNFLADKKTTILISEKEKPPAIFGFLMKKPALAQKFDYLTGSVWKLFIQKEAEKRGLEFSQIALNFLAKIYEGDTWRLITEIDKLSFLNERKLDQKDLEKLNLEIPADFWNLLSELKTKNLANRLSALERLFYQQEPAGKIFNILSVFWREKLPQFARLDLMAKSGKLDYEEALLELTINC